MRPAHFPEHTFEKPEDLQFFLASHHLPAAKFWIGIDERGNPNNIKTKLEDYVFSQLREEYLKVDASDLWDPKFIGEVKRLKGVARVDIYNKIFLAHIETEPLELYQKRYDFAVHSSHQGSEDRFPRWVIFKDASIPDFLQGMGIVRIELHPTYVTGPPNIIKKKLDEAPIP